jgi:hypothetical protein
MTIPPLLLLLPPCWRCWTASLWRTCVSSAPLWAGAATLPAVKIWWKPENRRMGVRIATIQTIVKRRS